MPESANSVQQPQKIIEIRPYRGGWQCFEGLGVEPFWTGANAKKDAIGYAKGRAKFGHGEIRVLNADESVERVIPFEKSDKNTWRSLHSSRLGCGPLGMAPVDVIPNSGGTVECGQVAPIFREVATV